MSTDKTLTFNTSSIFRCRNKGYETQNELRLENQTFVFEFEHHFKTTSIKS